MCWYPPHSLCIISCLVLFGPTLKILFHELWEQELKKKRKKSYYSGGGFSDRIINASIQGYRPSSYSVFLNALSSATCLY